MEREEKERMDAALRELIVKSVEEAAKQVQEDEERKEADDSKRLAAKNFVKANKHIPAKPQSAARSRKVITKAPHFSPEKRTTTPILDKSIQNEKPHHQ